MTKIMILDFDIDLSLEIGNLEFLTYFLAKMPV